LPFQPGASSTAFFSRLSSEPSENKRQAAHIPTKFAAWSGHLASSPFLEKDEESSPPDETSSIWRFPLDEGDSSKFNFLVPARPKRSAGQETVAHFCFFAQSP
jgi:hypothetical protein